MLARKQLSVRVDPQPLNKIYQRAIGGTTRVISFTGKTAMNGNIEAQVLDATDGTTVLVPWQTLIVAPTSTWSATLTVPQGGKYLGQLRDSGPSARACWHASPACR
jgi:hypothetical protein